MLFFSAVTWLLARDGSLHRSDGLVLIGLFLFWQLFQIFEMMKTNIRKKLSISKWVFFDLALVGGATGMIGDPSGKSNERNLLDEETLAKNIKGVKQTLERFIDFSGAVDNSAEMVNNYDWMKGLSFLDFARDIGKHITVNQGRDGNRYGRDFDLDDFEDFDSVK